MLLKQGKLTQMVCYFQKTCTKKCSKLKLCEHLNFCFTEALWHLRDEKNIGSQLGAMAVGGILGLIAARKRGFIKRITNMFVGVGGNFFLSHL